MPFFDGDMAASETPATRPLTRGQASQHDFPSIAAKGDDLFVAWTTYHNEANFVYLAHRTGGVWKEYEVTRGWGDYYASAVAIDGSGKVTVVWGEFKDNRWRLVYRILSPASGQWSNEAYVAPAGRRQMFPRTTTDAAGYSWLVWQEFASANFDVFASRLGPRGWSTPVRVSESPANDWQPAVAAAADGTVWVAWDSYDEGNYDVLLRPIRNGRPEAIVRVTSAPTFDAHVSLAADPSNDVWLAWEEAGPNWGKDSGTLGRPGAMLFESRRIRVVRYDGVKFSEPPQPLETALAPWAQSFNSSPQIAVGANGLPYIIWQHLMFRPAMPENDLNIQLGSIKHDRQPWYDTLLQLWEVYYAAFDGARWTSARQLPQSEGRCAVQSGWALSGDRVGLRMANGWKDLQRPVRAHGAA
jgi:hypothetical protein